MSRVEWPLDQNKESNVIDGLIAGKIQVQAKQGLGKNGSQYVTAKVRAMGADGEPLIVNVIAFAGDACRALLALAEGESVALAGSLTPKVWVDKDRGGMVRPALDMQAHAVLTAHQAKAE